MGLHMGRRLFRSVQWKAGPDIRLLASGGSPLEPRLASDLDALGWPVATLTNHFHLMRTWNLISKSIP